MSVKVARMSAQGISARHMAQMGDPGLFGFLGKIGGKIIKAGAGAVGGMLSGGPVGALGGALGGVLGGGSAPRLPVTTGGIARGGLPATIAGVGGALAGAGMAKLGSGNQGPGFGIPGTGIRVSPGDIFPGGADFLQRQAGSAGACPSGFRPNKSSYFLKDGTFVPEGSRCVRRRRRNNLNPRALTRALGRVEGFKKATSRASRITVRKKKC